MAKCMAVLQKYVIFQCMQQFVKNNKVYSISCLFSWSRITVFVTKISPLVKIKIFQRLFRGQAFVFNFNADLCTVDCIISNNVLTKNFKYLILLKILNKTIIQNKTYFKMKNCFVLKIFFSGNNLKSFHNQYHKFFR